MRGLHTGAAIITVKPSEPVYKVCVLYVFTADANVATYSTMQSEILAWLK